ncbi:hypothetical protein Q4532_15735, partial [Shewanella sp. 7_MG-2023]|nr:hypothetical protein [Shewanella sp. 7_MG-2023]
EDGVPGQGPEVDPSNPIEDGTPSRPVEVGPSNPIEDVTPSHPIEDGTPENMAKTVEAMSAEQKSNLRRKAAQIRDAVKARFDR